jgi:ribonuclease H / adenosylcobalamin/alpha-ribazole phosphatase
VSATAPEGLTRLALVRHGETSGNREMRYLGSTDQPLTDRGRTQADEVAWALTAYPLQAVYTSPLARAAATAEAIARMAKLEVRIEPGLRETDYGDWEGLTRAEALARDGERLRQWEADPDVAPLGGGESLRQTQHRVAACVDQLALAHPGLTLALVTHVGPVKGLVCRALGLGPEGARRMWLDPASITIVDWPASRGGQAILRLYNVTSHLAEGARWLART